MRRRAVTAGIVVCGLVHLAAAAWVLAVFPQLPGRLVSHWGTDGPDGYISRDHAVWLLLGSLTFCVVFTLLLAALTPKHSGAAVAGLGAGMGAFLAALLGGTMALQAGTTQSAPLQFRSWWLLGAIAIAVALGALAARVVGPAPPRPVATRIPPQSERLAQSQTGRSWHSTVSSDRGFLLILLLPLPVFLVLAVATKDWLLPLVLTLLVATPLLGMWHWRLLVDGTGFHARGTLGWPRVHHPLHEIEQASVLPRVEVMEFGGPGLRLTPQGARLVLRSGPALRLELSDRTDFIATVPDAQLCARTINTLISAERGS